MSRSARTLLAITAATGAALSVMAAASSPLPAWPRSGPALPRLRSLYVPMPDGVRLAADVWLPAGTTAGDRLPTVLETDRYWRARAYTGGIKDNPNYQIALPWNPARLRVRVRRPARHGRLVRHAHRRARQRDDRRRGLAGRLDRRAALVERAGRA